MLNKFYITAIETLINKYWAPIIGIFSLCSRHIFKDQTYYVKSLYFYHILVHWEDLEGSGGEEGGRGDRDGEDM